ncbi:MAG: hypothetical protein HRU75_09605 [Planctomycetia bacterium]|nr:MAG: hypothetical protein HRU75_09605 [Planctomycetia bacterium]
MLNFRRLFSRKLRLDDARQRAIAETSAFLTWHLDHPEHAVAIPVIPSTSGRRFPPSLTEAFWAPLLTD